ncbi:hypothetical protein BGZ47_003577 [Haplosporangium gracile]|nr:hypothetical protein BGZ47_003577 [Haplosporangium gracile]
MSTINADPRHQLTYLPVTTNLQEEWAQLGQTQQAIPYLQQQIESGLSLHHQQPGQDYSDCERDYAGDADLMLWLTPRSKRRKLESLAVSSAIPRDLAMLKLEHIRAIYQHEQNALVEMMRSHRSTTELYKETLRILSEDQVCTSNNVYTSVNRSGHIGQIRPRDWDASNQGFDQTLDPSHYFKEAVLLPLDRPTQPSTALVVTPPNRKRTRVQQTPSPQPFFNMDIVPGEDTSDITSQMLGHSRPLTNDPTESRVKTPFTSNVATSGAEGIGNESQSVASENNRIPPVEPDSRASNGPREPERRLKRPVSRVGSSTLPILSEQDDGTLYVATDTNTLAPSRPVSSLNVPQPVSRRPVDSQDLIVGNQRPRPTSALPKTPKKQLTTSPYRRQVSLATTKVSPFTAAKRDHYVQERAKAKAQSKKLVVKFSNKSTGAQSSTSSDTSLTVKSEDVAMTTELISDNKVNEVVLGTEKDSIDLTTLTPPTNTKIASASGMSITRSPSRISCAIRQQHRSRSTSSSASHRSGFHLDKLKFLTAGQLLRRMNKSLLGSSRPPVLPRTIVEKGVFSKVQLATRIPAAERLSSAVTVVTTEPSTSTPSTTSTSSTASSSSSNATPASTTETEPIAEAATIQTIPPVATMTKVQTTTKPSTKSAASMKSRGVTRSLLSDRFRRVTRSTTAAASQML